MIRHRKLFFTTALLCACAICEPVFPFQDGEKLQLPTFEEVISLRAAGSPVVSPDGAATAFTVRSTDWRENRYDTEIWLSRQGDEPFPLTRTRDGSSHSPKWSPDGRWLAFLADRGDETQLHAIRLAGGEARPVTSFEQGVSAFEWSPEGARFAVAVEETAEEKEQRSEKYGSFEVEDQEYRQTHLWLIDFESERPEPFESPDSEEESSDPDEGPPGSRRLTGGDLTIVDFEWSPDGSRIVVQHQPDPLINSFFDSDISILRVEDGELRSLVENPSYDGSPEWSPDGRQIAYATALSDRESNYYRNTRLFVIPASGGMPRQVAEDFDEDPRLLDWTGAGIHFAAARRTERHLFLLDPESGTWNRVADSLPHIYGASFSNDGRIMALSGRHDDMLSEVYLGSPDKELKRLTHMSAQIDEWKTARSEVIRWESRDGTEIEGVLHKPRDFDPSRKYPLLVIIHGGPTGVDSPQPVPGYVYPVLQWLDRGALILRPNYRGSAGYGEGFRSLNVRNLGVGDVWDVLSGVEHLVEEGMADPDRLGAMGWSQGGYISAFLTTTTDRFQAVSVGAGISNWVTYYVNTDIHPFTRQYLKATPWEDQEIYEKTSPITYVADASTPTLIQHGEFDRRVPIPNAYELFQALQDVGVETRLIVYKGFGHGINKPKERLAATWHNWQWFGRHIWGEEIKLPLDLEETPE